jgi:protein ImuB
LGRRPPLVVCAPVRGKDRVIACSRSARRLGITVGMLQADAESLAGKGVRFEPHDPLADARRLRELVAIGRQFSPTVMIEPGESPEAVFLDATGCGPGFGGEMAFAGRLIDAVRDRGYWAVTAMANTIGAAWGVARYGTGSRARVVIVPPGGQEEALRPLPVEALRLDLRAVEVLHELNIVRVEQLLALPREQLPSRFGTELSAAIDRALGGLPEELRPEPVVEPLETRWGFEPPVADSQVLLAVIEKLLGRLLKELRRRDVGFKKLLWWLRLDGADRVCVPVELLRPTVVIKDLVELIRLQLERLKLPGEVTDLVVRAAAVAPLVYRQGDLFGGRVGSTHEEDVAGLIERLTSRLGPASVLRPRLVAEELPELAAEFDPWATAPKRPPVVRPPAALTRPPVLRDPEPVRVLPASGAPPGWLQWADREYTVERSWGPERIETGWWRGSDVRRDYYVLETTDGERFWVYRDLAAGGWYVQGVFQ